MVITLLTQGQLELSDNRLNGGIDTLAASCPNLQNLKVANNRIKSLDGFVSMLRSKALVSYPR